MLEHALENAIGGREIHTFEKQFKIKYFLIRSHSILIHSSPYVWNIERVRLVTKGSWHSIRQKRFQCPLIQMLHEGILDSWWQSVYICKPTVTISALSFWGCQYLCSPRLVTTQPLCNSDFHGCSSFFFSLLGWPKTHSDIWLPKGEHTTSNRLWG